MGYPISHGDSDRVHWLSATLLPTGVPTGNANQTMHPSSLSLAIHKLLIRFKDLTAVNAIPSARERGDRRRSRDQPTPVIHAAIGVLERTPIGFHHASVSWDSLLKSRFDWCAVDAADGGKPTSVDINTVDRRLTCRLLIRTLKFPLAIPIGYISSQR
ncbi:MAG: hypothetical protein KDB00_07750 [Planctomycetales bacterium]|nr:hypothetical protein [Planctomycetales bacterium]